VGAKSENTNACCQ